MSHKTTLVHLTLEGRNPITGVLATPRKIVLNPHHIAALHDCKTGCWLSIAGRADEDDLRLAESYETALALWYSALSE